MKKNLLVALFVLGLAWPCKAQVQRSFAVVSDRPCHEHCRRQMEAYAESVSRDGLSAFICARDWDTPEQVRDSLRKWYENKALAGAVFIGDIPVPMIRKAQHMTSAFKMDEQRSVRRDSSVPSDRFYDDFDLKFRFAGRDSAETSFFYYELAPESAQSISCDIFTGRIRPSAHFQDRYEELSAYLEKVVRLKRQDRDNRLDHIVSYTGSGSFSDSMIAWKDETVTLEEQAPDAFKTLDGAKFFVFYQFPYMKDIMLRESRRPEADLMFWHHHGTPERQWIGNEPYAHDDDSYYEAARRQARQLVRRKVLYGATPEEAMRSVRETYRLDSTWVCDAFSPEAVAADSLSDIKTGILLDDVWAAKPNARMHVFDACYNGDFREEDFIANRYIMSGGDAVVALGNSVNVLQDKASSTLLGMLSAGYNVGQMHQMSAILESHVIGDPTWHFASSYSFEAPDFYNRNIAYWQRWLADAYPCDIRSLALYKLYELRDPSLPARLSELSEHAPYYMLRLNALTLLKHYAGERYGKALLAALDDPYEYIRRKAVHNICQRGEAEHAEAVARAYLLDYNAKRVEFNAVNNSAFFPDSLLLQAYDREAARQGFLFEKPVIPDSLRIPSSLFTLGSGRKGFVSSLGVRAYAREAVEKKGNDSRRRHSTLSMMRNMPYPTLAMPLVDIVRDSEEPLSIRIQVAEILGWFVQAHNRDKIAASLEQFLSEGGPVDPALKDEVVKTVGRLKDYLR